MIFHVLIFYKKIKKKTYDESLKFVSLQIVSLRELKL